MNRIPAVSSLDIILAPFIPVNSPPRLVWHTAQHSNRYSPRRQPGIPVIVPSLNPAQFPSFPQRFPLRAGQLPVTVDVPYVVTTNTIARRWFVSHAARRCPVSQVAFVFPLLLVDRLDCVYCFCISSPFYGPHVFASSSALSSKLLFFSCMLQSVRDFEIFLF